MAELILEVTEGLDQELKEMADAQLVTKEDMARRILAKCVLESSKKPSFFGFDPVVLGKTLQIVGAQLVEIAQEKGKEEES